MKYLQPASESPYPIPTLLPLPEAYGQLESILRNFLNRSESRAIAFDQQAVTRELETLAREIQNRYPVFSEGYENFQNLLGQNLEC